ncbi:hypothetical protein RJ640_021654 [Escallonia rubra]|uniref:Two-pore potassium channel 5 n=1 Tax=Escallonia rubra TaxID=112253 RepID=A0AA88QI13_9ASTE|nr:hypothetical protein RJ640_021654 [Escallonia rubra]
MVMVMEEESFLTSRTPPQLQSLLHHDCSLTHTLLNPPFLFHQHLQNPSSSSSSSSSCANASESSASQPGGSPHAHNSKIHRCKTAPAMAAMRDLLKPHNLPKPDPGASLVRQAALLLLLYLSLGILIYSFNGDHFSGAETHPIVDALYFCIVTMCTIGYGDIAPLSPQAKLFDCFFVLVGFGFIHILLSGVVNYVLDLQENMILTGTRVDPQKPEKRKGGFPFSARNFIVDVVKGRMRIRLKVGLALGVVFLCIGIGALLLYFVERLDWIDSLYLSVMSVTTVGYGDRAFKTTAGRLFASIWLLLSTLAVARAFLYLAEARIDKRHRRVTKWVLHRDITVEDLLAADINNNGFISKSEYIIYKLKEMGKIGEKDVMQICNQFNKLDRNNSGKITLPYLLEDHL